MPFISLQLDTTEPEFAEELLLACGALSVSLTDSGDVPVLEPAPGETPLWPLTTVSGLFHPEADIDHAERQLRQLMTAPEQRVRRETIEDRDWVRIWLEHCEPIQFGQRLWVCPEAKRVEEENCQTLILDPGLAFGTGSHPSTALCLEWLATHSIDGFEVLDYGCGSGILAIAALLLGADRAIAYDIDPQAVIAAQDNALRNGVAKQLEVLEHDQPPASHTFDLVLANILARPLIELAPTLCTHLKPGGHIVLAGLLQRQAEEVRSAYAPWIEFDTALERDGWTCLNGRRS